MIKFVKKIFYMQPKKIILITSLILASFYNSNSQILTKMGEMKRKPYKSIIMFYPFALISKTFMVGFETKILEKKTLRSNFALTSADNLSYYEIKMENVTEIYLEFQYRLYLNDSSFAGKGFYFAPLVTGKNIYFTEVDYQVIYNNQSPFVSNVTNTSDKTAGSVASGLVFGVQMEPLKRFYLDMYIGAKIQYSFGQYRGIETFPNSYTRGVFPQIGIAVGFGI